MRSGLWSLSRHDCKSSAWNISRACGCQLHHKFKERRSSPRILSGKLGRRGGRLEFSFLRLIPKFIRAPFESMIPMTLVCRLTESQTATIYRAFNLAILQRRTETLVLQHTFRIKNALEVA